MSNRKKDLEEIWNILGYWKTGKIHIKWWFDEDGCRVDCTDEIAEATTQIINLIESVIPEDEPYPRPASQKDYDFDNPRHRYTQGFWVGHTQAIKDIKSKLIGKE